nr:hypothetical protein [Bacteroidota bacterium]
DNVCVKESNRILRIRYEDFLLDHENQAKVIKSFINLPSDIRINNNSNFDITKSVQNVGIWKKYEHLTAIKTIHKELHQYCYQL